MEIKFIKKDISKVSANAIVLPANEHLKEGLGVSKAIFAAAGKEQLTEACAEIGFCNTCESVSTPAFNLKAEHIIHSVVPNRHNSITEDTDYLLCSTYTSALQLADDLCCRSVAIPLLGSGHMGFTSEDSLIVALVAINSFESKNLKVAIICIYNDTDTDLVLNRGYTFSDSGVDYRITDRDSVIIENSSNINIAPNIYVRTDNNITHDIEYVKHIVGPKLLKSLQEKIIPIVPAKLSPLQIQIIKESKTCYYVKNGQQTHGIVKNTDGICWSNRCEKSECPLYDQCMSSQYAKRIERNGIITFETRPEIEDTINLEQLGIRINGESIDYSRPVQILTNEVTFDEQEPALIEISEPEMPTSIEYERIGEPDEIIDSSINSHIILNSGPGTGKTYTIVQRLIYILSNQLCNAENIYILCYTRSAKKVIVDKINDAIANGIIPTSAQNICILTFDSYATYFLMAIKDQMDEDITECNYNERIKLFNKYITTDDFESVGYFIIDEIQDLVNERAQMVLNIVKNLNCGFLLAGDRCQAIYDYEAEGSATIDSVEFYRQLEILLPQDIKRYEIIGNRRQCAELAAESEKLRDILLNCKDIRKQNKNANTVIDQYKESIHIEKYIRELSSAPNKSTAILCRSNGEAEYISSLLAQNNIPHDLNRGVNNQKSLAKWIADVFWDYCEKNISKAEFLERVDFRTSTEYSGEHLWEICCNLLHVENASSLSMSKLVFALTLTNDLPSEFFEKGNNLVVSTIHKAKGSEFDRVILINSNIQLSSTSAEEARIRYVAITRPKNQLAVMKKNNVFFRKSTTGRPIQTKICYSYKTNNVYCSSLSVGFSNDIMPSSFVSGNFDQVIDNQSYIINNVNIHDRLIAVRSASEKTFKIYHNDHHIGNFSLDMYEEVFWGINATNFKYNMPIELSDFYVKAITTQILREHNESIPDEFQNSRICYGIQIGGMAKLKFN